MSDQGHATSPAFQRQPKSQPESVTYVIVVHGMGEQRKNETVINVVNRFAEARCASLPDDNRDVLTLGPACAQTGFSKVPVAEQPWMEFKGIPADPNCCRPTIFLGQQSSTGDHLRFVDLCWSDIMHDSINHVGQRVDVWARGLLGRLLRKHEHAMRSPGTAAAHVPFWIRRVLHLLADCLLLVRFAMTFRFKELEDLVFAKFLGDVQLYGEYARCRGGAVRRFHEMLARIETAHAAREAKSGHSPPRPARYLIIAHSLGSIMSLDSLIYAAAPTAVRRGQDKVWNFPGYIRNDDDHCDEGDLCRLDDLRRQARGTLSSEDKGTLADLERRFAFLDTGWIERVHGFVTLGSPIDKYLMIWWLNYRYLLNGGNWFAETGQNRMAHFNYCDELDPVGHNLDVVSSTPVYRALFERREDIVFNRYTVPGAAHNAYWTDQELFNWILARGLDQRPATPPRLFDLPIYRKLLSRLFSWAPFLSLLGIYGSMSLGLQAHGWRTAAVAGLVLAFLVLIGRHVVDLGIWWRRIQRRSDSNWPGVTDGYPQQELNKQRRARSEAAGRFRAKIATVPWVFATVTAVLCLFVGWIPDQGECCQKRWLEWAVQLVVILAVSGFVFWLRPRLPRAYIAWQANGQVWVRLAARHVNGDVEPATWRRTARA